MGKLAAKCLAAAGAGGISAILLAGVAAVLHHFDPTSPAGAAAIVICGSLGSSISGWAVSQAGPKA